MRSILAVAAVLVLNVCVYWGWHHGARHVTERARLEPWMDPPMEHGLHLVVLSLAGKTWISIDTDTGRLEARQDSPDPWLSPVSRTLSAAELERLREATEDAWRADPPDFDHATDIRVALVAVDHDDTLLVDYDGSLDPDSAASRLERAIQDAAWPSRE